MKQVLFIAAGGALGSVLRFGVAGAVQGLTGGTFPIGTLVVNLVGCPLIGLINGALTGPIQVAPEYRLALTIGLLGGMTTFSRFGWETVELLDSREWWRAGLNVLASVALGLAAVWLGHRLALRWLGV